MFELKSGLVAARFIVGVSGFSSSLDYLSIVFPVGCEIQNSANVTSFLGGHHSGPTQRYTIMLRILYRSACSCVHVQQLLANRDLITAIS